VPKLIVVRDSDDYINTVVEPPISLDHEAAMEAVADAIATAKTTIDDWNYDDVNEALEAKGFTIHEYDELDEG
jgi:hypothetical protein